MKYQEIMQRSWLYLNYPYRSIDQSGWEFYSLVEPNVYGNIWLGDASTDKRGYLLIGAAPYWRYTKQSFEEYQQSVNQQQQPK